METIGLSQAATKAKSFLWSFPGCPVQIHLSLDLIERLRSEVLALAPADAEVGGLLIGSASPYSADVQVSDYFLVPSTGGAAQYLVCANGLEQALASCSATQRNVIGYFRTHLAPRVQLRAEELECIRKSFSEPKNVFLVIRPHDGRASGGFFFWQEGSVFGESTLTFPFSAADLGKQEWTTLVGGLPAESRINSVTKRARETMKLASSRINLALFAVAVLFVILLFTGRELIPVEHTPKKVLGALGLAARRDGLALAVTWNPTSFKQTGIREANLLIWDGPGQPVYLPLSPEQLRSGGTLVTTVSDKVSIRLDIVSESGEAKIESTSLAREEPVTASNQPSAAAPPEPFARTAQPGKQEQSAKMQASIQTPSPGGPAVSATGPATSATASAQAATAQPPKRWKILDEASGPSGAGPAGGSVTQSAQPVTETQPDLPGDLKARISADNTIGVLIKISTTGKVIEAKRAFGRGPSVEVLAGYAVAAAWRWRFRPAMQNGKPVQSEKTIEFLFRPPGQ